MENIPIPADGLRAFDLGPNVFREIAKWTKTSKARIVHRTVVHGQTPAVLVAYVLDKAA